MKFSLPVELSFSGCSSFWAWECSLHHDVGLFSSIFFKRRDCV